MSGDGRLSEVRAAVERADWEGALGILADAGPAADSAEGLELRAQAAYGNGDFEASVTAWEDLYSLLTAEGDDVEAARAAAMIAMYLMMDTGLMAPVRGWLSRAERLLEDHESAPADAIIAMTRTYERFMCGDMDGARRQSALAIELGERLGVQPAVVIGRVASARVMIFDGHLDEGLDALDEVAVLLMSGEVDPLTTGMMYCELICAAQGLALHDRAREWTEVMQRWRHGAAIGGINGRCRVHRAEILRISGPADAAEAEALGACEDLRPWMRREFGWPLVELGNIRLRKGDLDGAEEAFVAAHGHAWSPHPGMALLKLEQGDVESASALIADAIAHPFAIPSKERPPFGDLRLAPLLDAQAEIAAAAGDVETLTAAADGLESIASAFPGPGLEASASLAKARAALLRGDLDSAIEGSRAAVVSWAELGAPFDTARARLVLADAHHRSGNHDAALMEWQAARTAFEEFGAQRWAARTDRLLAGAPSGPPSAGPGRVDQSVAAPEAPARVATFRCDGDTRTVSFGGLTVSMRDLKGLRYLERLLAEPAREFHVLDLVAVERGTLLIGPDADPLVDEGVGVTDDAIPMLDDEAREAYRRRLTEVEEDIDEATRLNDMGRLELAQHDREYLIAELSRATGLGGRHRSSGGTAERARTSVTRSLRYALNRLAEHHPSLAAHLGQSVRTGMYCSYTPDPLSPVDWEI